jgi:1-pyrroline-5-carboxylate dehydrogenase
MNVSVTKPHNQALTDYRGDDREWSAFEAAVRGIPQGFRVPMIVGGEEIHGEEQEQCLDPSTGEVFCTFSLATPDQASGAVRAALAAKPGWASLPMTARLAKFRDLEAILYERRHEICAVAAHECGYNAAEVSGGWAEMMDFIRFNPYYYLDLCRTTLGDGDRETNTLNLRPLKGFTSAITPFNFPIAIGYNLPTVMALCGKMTNCKG